VIPIDMCAPARAFADITRSCAPWQPLWLPRSMTTPMAVARYEALPAEVKRALPAADQIEGGIEHAAEAVQLTVSDYSADLEDKQRWQDFGSLRRDFRERDRSTKAIACWWGVRVRVLPGPTSRQKAPFHMEAGPFSYSQVRDS
jgi:hypothetical protein